MKLPAKSPNCPIMAEQHGSDHKKINNRDEFPFCIGSYPLFAGQQFPMMVRAAGQNEALCFGVDVTNRAGDYYVVGRNIAQLCFDLQLPFSNICFLRVFRSLPEASATQRQQRSPPDPLYLEI
ncbi:hypothetical protein ZIOFF_004773 [Zingiber officinale]|uniref:Uncharacterized protein n=1 Tax=Zingiber officinale TaxID=94328 RepID=A0A8J5HLK9_ZINOF|nr:hypothetical protein ZIOFF_004773 [Zingiber officinale]